MATVVMLTEEAGRSPSGNAGAIVRDRAKAERKAKADTNRAEQLSNLFLELNNEDGIDMQAVSKTIKDGAITKSSDLMSLISQMRLNKDSNSNVVVDAFTSGGKKTKFALSKEDLSTGGGEKKANAIGLTIRNPGKVVDYYHDTPTQKFAGSSTGRIKTKITLDEWKSKYGKEGKPTDKATAVGDYLSGNKLESNAVNRTNAREFLFNRNKATEVINAAFGKKTGADWTIDDPLKNQMAIIAKMQVEGFIMSDGTTAEQAGGQAVSLVKELFKDQIEDANAPIDIKQEMVNLLRYLKI